MNPRHITLWAILLLWMAPCFALADTTPGGTTLHALDFIIPQGHWATRLELRANGYNKTYDEHGTLLPLGHRFDGLTLDAAALPMLAPFGPGASLGDTRSTSRVRGRFVKLTLGYGVTPNLTAGVILPYGSVEDRVDFSVTGGNLGWNPLFDPGQPVGPANAPFGPVDGTVITEPVGTAGVQQILASPAFGYGYAPLGTATTTGWGDPTVGVLWRVYKGPRDSAVLGLGSRFGWAKADDPDNLSDVPIGDGTTDPIAQMDYFRALSHGFDLHLYGTYQWALPDHATMRVPAPGAPLAPAASTERIKRDKGDYAEYDVELGHATGPWRYSTTWHLYRKKADRYTAPSGADTSALNAYSSEHGDQYRLSVSWSGVEAWQAQRLPLPLIVRLEFQDTYDGRNFVGVRDLYLQVTALM